MNRLNCLMLCGVFVVQAVLADEHSEHQVLAQLVYELNAIDPLIDQAQSNADQDARIRFQYDWLRIDLERIRSGIHNHLVEPRQQPRTIPPLKGDYRQ